MSDADEKKRTALEVTCTQLPDGRWTARTRSHPDLVGVGQTSESAVRDLADAIEESGRDD
jgi:predicted RNase H-like HicB family nuclease